MNRQDVEKYVSFALNDRGVPRPVAELSRRPMAVLVGWQVGFEPLFIAVWSDLDLPLYQGDAIDIATQFLESINWFPGEPTDPDFVVGGT